MASLTAAGDSESGVSHQKTLTEAVLLEQIRSVEGVDPVKVKNHHWGVGGSSHLRSLVCLFSTDFQLTVQQREGFLGGVCVRDVSVGADRPLALPSTNPQSREE